MVYKHAVIAAFRKMLLKGKVGDHALNRHGNYIVDHGKSWKNHGIVFWNFCGNPVVTTKTAVSSHSIALSFSINIIVHSSNLYFT